MYLKRKGLKISGSNAESIDRVLTHARGNLSARDAVEHEEFMRKRHKLRVDIRQRVI